MGRKSRLKERIKNPTTLGVNPMALVTYRGVQYDTNDKKSCLKIKADLTYRGIKHSQEKEYCVVTP